MTTEPTPADSTTTNITETPALTPPPAAPSVESLPAPAPPTLPQEIAPTWPAKVDIAILGLLLVLTFFLASFTATNSELWMHLAIGKRISEGNFAFGVDPYSWATEEFGGRPAVYWVHHSWLYSWLVFHLYSLAGGMALVIGKAIVFTASIALLSRIGWGEANRWFVLICLAMAALATSTRLFLQPMVVSLLFLSITLFVLDRVGVFALQRAESAPDRTRWLWSLPPLFALWANLDHWFILGPLLLALCWAGAALAKWYPNGNPVPGKTIGAVLGVSVLACVLNPHHVRVFELPPELAYVMLTIADPLHIPLPDALVAAGRTVKELTRIETNSAWALSPLSSSYWQPNLGLNVAGLAFFPLLVLGLVAFTLVALIKPQPNAPTLQVNRFLLWLVFAVLALALFRMVPFFVLIAAPLTATTLGEFLHWQQTSNAQGVDGAGRRDRGLNLARLVSLPLMLALLYWAWPGWLHGTGTGNDYSAPRRVAWEVRPDGSLKQAALALHALQEQGKCGNVFNTNRDLGNYLPWFAPDVKYFMDTRFSLYPGRAAAHDKARRALIDPGQPASDWQTLFKERSIDQVALTPASDWHALAKERQIDQAIRAKLMEEFLMRWWLDGEQWRQRYGDHRALVLSWAGLNHSWPTSTSSDDLNRQAFGPVPEDQRPPQRGTPPAQTQGVLTLYLDGVPPSPVQVGECLLRQEQYSLTKELMNRHFRGFSVLFMTGSQSCLPVSTMTVVPGLEVQLRLSQFVPLLDRGPPALPILMVRGARQAVAENPLDPGSYFVLRVANEVLRNDQEDHWAGFQRASRSVHPSQLRDRLRQTQLLAAAYQVVQLQPDNPDQHKYLADQYYKQNLLDLALEHLQEHFKGLQARVASGKSPIKNPKDQEKFLKDYYSRVIDPLDKSVRSRLAKFKESTEQLTPLHKVGYALQQPYQEFGEAGKQETALGLGKKALELLLAIDQESLEPENHLQYLALRFELLLSMGHVDAVAANLKEDGVRKVLGPLRYATYQLFAAGALGDYEAMDEALSVLEKGFRDGAKSKRDGVNRQRSLCVPSMFLLPGQQSAAALSVSVTLQTMKPLIDLNQAQAESASLHNELFNAMTLRGIVALEAGDTKGARALFQKTLSEAGDQHFFSDRNIAKRYLDLLNQQH